jgi:hypothetical protein
MTPMSLYLNLAPLRTLTTLDTLREVPHAINDLVDVFSVNQPLSIVEDCLHLY